MMTLRLFLRVLELNFRDTVTLRILQRRSKNVHTQITDIVNLILKRIGRLNPCFLSQIPGSSVILRTILDDGIALWFYTRN